MEIFIFGGGRGRLGLKIVILKKELNHKETICGELTRAPSILGLMRQEAEKLLCIVIKEKNGTASAVPFFTL